MISRARKSSATSAGLTRLAPARKTKSAGKAAAYTASSGNVFADLGLPDADVHLAKAQLVMQISQVIEDRGLTQSVAAQAMGVSQPDLSKMLRGQFRPVSIEKLMLCLVALGRSVTITVERSTKRKGGKLEVV